MSRTLFQRRETGRERSQGSFAAVAATRLEKWLGMNRTESRESLAVVSEPDASAPVGKVRRNTSSFSQTLVVQRSRPSYATNKFSTIKRLFFGKETAESAETPVSDVPAAPSPSPTDELEDAVSEAALAAVEAMQTQPTAKEPEPRERAESGPAKEPEQPAWEEREAVVLRDERTMDL
jgi:hypothetical protein